MFKKNQSGNPLGRPTGAKSKAPQEIKEAFQSLVEGNLSNLEIWLKEVAKEDPKEAIILVLRLAEYCVPKLKAIETKTEISDTINIGFSNKPLFTFQDWSGKTIDSIE